ncbi:hypothetical protein GF377_06310 [candidate division GN15 bacterium]|nr:hypothetical protein [candidate division GN15 bacterium]
MDRTFCKSFRWLAAVGWVPAVLVLVMVAQPNARELTLAQALTMAAEHSHSLKQAAAERAAAEEMVGAARAERLPTVSATAVASYMSEVAQLEFVVPGLIDISRDFGSKETYQTDIRLTWPVFTGGKISSGIKAAEASRDYRQAMESVDEQATAFYARVAYLSLLRARQLVVAAEASLERTQVVLDDVLSAHSAGVTDTLDILEAELALSKAESGLTEATVRYRQAQVQLARLLGLSDEQINPSDRLPEVPAVDSSIAIDNVARPELNAAGAGVRLGEARLRLEHADYFPNLAVYGGYSYGKPNLDRFNNTWNDYFTVGAQLTWSFNIGNKTGSEKRAAAFQLESARRSYDDVQESLNESARLAWQDVVLVQSVFVSANKEHAIAAENYRLAQQSHAEGALSSNRLLEIEEALSAAEASLAAARANFFIAQSGYLYAIGSDDLGKGF